MNVVHTFLQFRHDLENICSKIMNVSARLQVGHQNDHVRNCLRNKNGESLFSILGILFEANMLVVIHFFGSGNLSSDGEDEGIPHCTVFCKLLQYPFWPQSYILLV